MVGGLLVSQVLNLSTTPCYYIFFDKLARSFYVRRKPVCIAFWQTTTRYLQGFS